VEQQNIRQFGPIANRGETREPSAIAQAIEPMKKQAQVEVAATPQALNNADHQRCACVVLRKALG
jgi:hypothetical protein